MKINGMMGGLALLCGMFAHTSVQAQCWQQPSIEAAQIREFDIMLMVSALRCQVEGVDFVADYNRFVSGNHAVLVAANDELIRHFNAVMGGQDALDAYDRMEVAMANRHGDDGSVGNDCAELRTMAILATVAPFDSTQAFLLASAQRVGMDPPLPGGPCGVVIADATSTTRTTSTRSVAFPATQMAMTH